MTKRQVRIDLAILMATCAALCLAGLAWSM